MRGPKIKVPIQISVAWGAARHNMSMRELKILRVWAIGRTVSSLIAKLTHQALVSKKIHWACWAKENC